MACVRTAELAWFQKHCNLGRKGVRVYHWVPAGMQGMSCQKMQLLSTLTFLLCAK